MATGFGFERIRDSLVNLFKSEKRPGAPSALTAGLTPASEVDPRNTWTPDLENRPENEVMGFVKFLHDEWLKIRTPYEPVWYTDLAFVVGQQWSTWDPYTSRLRLRKAPSWRRRLTINRILPTLYTLLGKINKDAHEASCFPSEQTPTGYADARMGERVLRCLHESLNLEDVYDEAIRWQLFTGNGFIYVGFNPDIGPKIELPDGTTMRAGDVEGEAFGPFEALAPSDMTGFRKPGRFMRARMVDIEILRGIYGEAAYRLVPDKEFYQADGEQWHSRARSLVSPLSVQGALQEGDDTNLVYVIELWEDPEVMNEEDAQKYPNGRHIVGSEAQSIVLNPDPADMGNEFENPYESQSGIPVSMFRDHRRPGQFWAGCRVDQMIPIQENYNKGRSDMVEARDITCKPILQAEQGHGIAKFIARPGAVFERAVGSQAPSWLAPPQMSSYHVQDIMDSDKDFQYVSQVPEVTRGELPYANIPGIGIDMLQEAADTPLSPLAKDIASGFSRVSTMILARVRQFYDEPRMMSTVGPGNEEDTFLFLRERHPTRIRAIVRSDQIFPRTKAAVRQSVREDIAAGILDPVRDRATILRLLEYGDMDTVWENDDLDRQNAWRENRMMAERGEPAVVQTFDNHEIHLYNHRKFQKSAEYIGLPDEIKMMFEMHVEETIAQLANDLGAIGQVTDPGMGPEEAMNPEAGMDAGAPEGMPPPTSGPEGMNQGEIQ